MDFYLQIKSMFESGLVDRQTLIDALIQVIDDKNAIVRELVKYEDFKKVVRQEHLERNENEELKTKTMA